MSRIGAALICAVVALAGGSGARADDDAWRVVFARAGALYSVAPDGSDLRRLTPDDGRWYGYPAASPDGRRIAFLSYDNPAKGDWDGGVHVAGVDGQGDRRVAHSDWGEPATGPPVWSPDGRRLVYWRLTGVGSGGIPSGDCVDARLVNVQTGGDRLLATTDEVAWSPDGARVAYVDAGECGGVRPRLVVRRAGGGQARGLGRGDSPHWAPRGGRLAFVRGGDVFTVRASGGLPRRVTRGKAQDDASRWAPGGGRLAFVRDGGLLDMQGRPLGQLFVVRADGRGLRRIGRADHRSVPVWTGSRLAWAADRGIYVGAADRAGSGRRIADGNSPTWVRAAVPVQLVAGQSSRSAESQARPPGLIVFTDRVAPRRYELFSIRPDGSRRTRLTRGARWAWTPDLAPDRRRVAFGRFAGVPDEDIGNEVAVASIRGGWRDIRVESEIAEYPAWSPNGRWIGYQEPLARGSGGAVTNGPTDVWIVRPDGSGRRRVVNGMADDSWFQVWDWSPDGKRVVFVGEGPSGEGRIGIAGVASAKVRWLTAGIAPDWGRGGIAYGRGRALRVIRPDGLDRRVAGLPKSETFAPSWSPDGSRLAFFGSSPSGGRDRLYVVRADGSGLRRIGPTTDPDPPVRWSPDGRWLVFSDGVWLYRVHAASGAVTRLTRGRDADWG